MQGSTAPSAGIPLLENAQSERSRSQVLEASVQPSPRRSTRPAVVLLLALSLLAAAAASVSAAAAHPQGSGPAVPPVTAFVLAAMGTPRLGDLLLPDPRLPDALLPEPRLSSAEAALFRFAPSVRWSSHPDALRTAFRAYYNYRTANPDRVRKPYLYFVDLGLDNRTPRGYVFDMDALELVEGPFAVAHGVGSSRERDAVPSLFSNQPGSKASSLGLYLAEETYAFNGRSGSGRYTSVGLRMRGESGPFNDAARRRGIVAHGAPYVTAGAAGRSEGCPAMEQHRARRLLPLLADGGVVFIYSPNHPNWLRDDPWVNAR
jgi:hypothetical protein